MKSREREHEPNRLILRWRLWWICRKLNLKPYKWQKMYALGLIDSTLGGRQSGKSTAVMLWALIRKKLTLKEAEAAAWKDPDCTDYRRLDWWLMEYWELAHKAGYQLRWKTSK